MATAILQKTKCQNKKAQLEDFADDFDNHNYNIENNELFIGKPCTKIHLWDAYFSAIIRLIEPNDKGYWEGVTLHYHLNTGWYDDGTWECDNPNLFFLQLESIDVNKLKEGGNIEKDSIEILKKLKDMVKNILNMKGTLIIEYF